MKISRELFPISSIIVMMVITVLSFIGNFTKEKAVICLILTFSSVFCYLLTSFCQNQPKLYILPYKIPELNMPQANRAIMNLIFRCKSLSILFLTLSAVAIYLEINAIVYISLILYCIILIALIIFCLNKLKRLR